MKYCSLLDCRVIYMWERYWKINICPFLDMSWIFQTLIYDNLIHPFVRQRWAALPGEPLPIDDDTEVDDWLPRFLVLQGLCIFLYSSSTGNLIETFSSMHFLVLPYFDASIIPMMLYHYTVCLPLPFIGQFWVSIRGRILQLFIGEVQTILNYSIL